MVSGDYIAIEYGGSSPWYRTGTMAKNTYYDIKANGGSWGAVAILNVSSYSSGTVTADLKSGSGVHALFQFIKDGIVTNSQRTSGGSVNFSNVDYIVILTNVGGSDDKTRFKITWT